MYLLQFHLKAVLGMQKAHEERPTKTRDVHCLLLQSSMSWACSSSGRAACSCKQGSSVLQLALW